MEREEELTVPKAILVVESRPIDPARADEYHDWYDNIHLKDVCAIPGFTGARRYTLSKIQQGEIDPARAEHIAIYEIEGPDLQEVLNGLRTRFESGDLGPGGDSIQVDPPPYVALFELREPGI